jgi:hypothetical protein
LSDAFTDYKDVTKSCNPAVNAPERVEVPKKLTQAPYVMKRGAATTEKDNASNKHPRKEKMMPLQKTANVSQRVVDRHHVDIDIPQSSTQPRYINETATMSENIDDLVLGNHETSNGIQEIFINYTSFGEVYDHSTKIVNSFFSTIIVEKVFADTDPKTMI